MRTILKTAAVTASVVLSLGLATPAFAAPGDNGKGLGGCVDNLYGNATNPRESGHGTLPSLSPGPATMGGGFFSVGMWQKAAPDYGFDRGADAVAIICMFP